MLRLLLSPLTLLYAAVTSLRNWLFSHDLILHERRFDLPVVSVGNLSVGGTGKTPHTEYLVRLFLTHERRTAVLSRGYGRHTKGYRLATSTSTADEIGDEPLQIFSKYPATTVAVCERRCEGIDRLVAEHRPDIIVLDDAFQHRYVKPGLSILLTDYARPYYADCPLPGGRLRETKHGARRADVVVVTKCPPTLTAAEAEEMRQRLHLQPSQQLFFSAMKYGERRRLFADEATSNAAAETAETAEAPTDVLVLTGIAKPAPLYAHLSQQGFSVHPLAFPDHHTFTPASFALMQKTFDALPAGSLVVTTEKDAARLRAHRDKLSDAFVQAVCVQPIEIEILFHEAPRFNQILTDYVDRNKRNCCVD